jgi:V/A-type H+-transporting ATPase subunit I
VFPLSEEASGLYTAILYHKREQDAVLQALSAMDFMRAPLPAVPQTARELLTDAEQRLEELEREAALLEARLASLAEKLSEVEVLWDIEKSRLLVAQNKQALASTAKCAVLRGWIPAGEEARIVATLSPLCTAYELEDPAPGDEPPVLLKNRGFAKSFEWVLGMYAYPRYGTYDPTLIMSVFYFLIFGLMFADAGYGALLCAACFSLVRWAQPRESMKRFLLMFGYCGISCTLFGILFGSYFGNFPLAFMENVLKLPPDRMPNLSLLPSEAANVAVLLDPLQDPMGFLLISLGMGALHLLSGMAVKAFLLCRQGKVIDALCDVLLYWVLFAGIGFGIYAFIRAMIRKGKSAVRQKQQKQAKSTNNQHHLYTVWKNTAPCAFPMKEQIHGKH